MRVDTESILGGQAVIEGVMMKAGKKYAVAVRSPEGDILSETFPVDTGRSVSILERTVFLRGLVILFSMLVIGVKALGYSASVAAEGEGESFPPYLLALTVLSALGIGVLVFFIAPFVAGVAVSRVTGLPVGGLWFNLVEGAFRILMFILYLGGISLMEDIRRVFKYHGAEHKVVNAYEDGAPLEAGTIMEYSRFHHRCGTSFILLVLIISVLAFSLIPADLSIPVKGAMRLLFLPVVAGISYEVIRASGKKKSSLCFRLISGPGLLLQRATTREPDIAEVEVALVSLRSLKEPPG